MHGAEAAAPAAEDADQDGIEQLDVDGQHWRLRRVGRAGTGPALLLLHGTGASLHSFAPLIRTLRGECTLLAPDLPGHGGSAALPVRSTSLPGFAAALGGLLAATGFQPMLLVGHSAGVAIALQMLLDRKLPPLPLVSINGAPVPLGGLAGRVFAPMARLIAEQGFVARAVARRAARPHMVERLLGGTGSRLDARGVAPYRELMARPEHVAGALRMMANWDLPALARELHRVDSPVQLLVGDRDRTLPRGYAERVHQMLPHARFVRLGGLGHLAHEEQPERIAACIRSALVPAGATPAGGTPVGGTPVGGTPVGGTPVGGTPGGAAEGAPANACASVPPVSNTGSDTG